MEDPATAEAPGEENLPLPERVERLACCGLDLEEILAWLDPVEPLTPELRDVLEAALARGRLLGRGAVKMAQYQSALDGRVTAQVQVLGRLGVNEPQEETGAETFEVVRTIIRPQRAEDD